MIRWTLLLLACCATLAQAQSSPAKKELVAKFVALQQSSIEEMAKSMAERPVMNLSQPVGAVLRTLPADKRDEAGKAIEADFKAYVDMATPLIRDRALKLASPTIGPAVEEKFTEDELRKLNEWFDSPVRKKYEQTWPPISNAMVKKLVDDIAPLLDPKLSALQEKVTNTLRAAGAKLPPSGQAGGSASGAKPAAPAPKPVAKPASK